MNKSNINPLTYKDLSIEPLYGPGVESPISFYSKVLPRTKEVELGLGYFSSTAFEALAKAFTWESEMIPSFRVISNDCLSSEDISVVSTELTDKDLSLSNLDIETFRKYWEALSSRKKRGYEFLRLLIEHDKFQLKLAYSPNGGIVHHKFAVFYDNNDNYIITHGSMNFSSNALLHNIETLHAIPSWFLDRYNVQVSDYYKNLFHRLWYNREKDVEVIGGDKVISILQKVVPRKSLKQLVSENNDEESTSTPKGNEKKEENTLLSKLTANGFKLREYQIRAIQSWKQNGFSGIWSMATGTGKTITAIQGIDYLKKSKNIGSLIVTVVVPSTVLIEQWAKQLEKEGYFEVIRAHGNVSKWERDLLNTVRYVCNRPGLIGIVATHYAFQKHIAHRLRKIDLQQVLVVDEVHTIGTEKGLNALPEEVEWRLGLSATPVRQYDNEGTERLFKYFKQQPSKQFIYTIKEAVEDGFLSPYSYTPLSVYLAEDEMEEYVELTEKIIRLINSDDEDIQQVCNQLLIKRHRIVERARNKLEPAVKLIAEIDNENDSPYGIIYSPDGDYPGEPGEEQSNEEWIDKIMKNIAKNNVIAHRFVQNDSEKHLDHFNLGKLNWLVAKKRLDEGVDIPRAENAIIIASSRTLRQYIQRRGRVLRTHNEKQQASIYDFLVLPPAEGKNESWNQIGKNLLVQELSRAYEFMRGSNNSKIVEKEIELLAENHDIYIDQIQNVNLQEEAIEYIDDAEEKSV